MVASITGTGCATDRKAREIVKRATTSTCDLSHLGKNKYYYSPKYKRHLDKNVKQIKRKRTSSMKATKIRL
jgi:hypothetical protein